MLDIPDADVRAGDASHLLRALREAGDKTGQLRGRLAIGFSSFAGDPRPDWLIPEIRHYFEVVDRAVPHLPYFLAPQPGFGPMRIYLLSLVPLQDPATGAVMPQDLVALAEEKVHTTRAFCEEIGEDAEEREFAIVSALPPALIRHDPDLVNRVSDAYRMILERMVRGPGGERRDIAPPLRYLIGEAGELMGMELNEYTSDEEALDAVLERMGPAATAEELGAFNHAVDAASQRLQGSKLGLKSDVLLQAVRDHRRGAYAYASTHTRLASSQPGYLKTAAIVAAAIEIALHDPWPRLEVEERARQLGISVESLMPETFVDLESARRNFQERRRDGSTE
jgi:hypothetical protein